MRFLSLFSGIEAASEAWTALGWECAGVAEIDPFACAVLTHRHPHVPNLGDITKITEMQIAALGHIDLIVFGSPCQDLSIAGKQKGLSGERSGLFYPAVDIINWARLWCGARFALWENVPGAFSSNQGRDFAAVVGTLAGLDDVGVPPKGWGTEGCAVGSEAMVEWATLDAQWFGVAQRRRRIFALADFGNWAGRPPILLEPEGVRGDSAPRREAGQSIARGFTTGSTGGGFTDTAPTLCCRCKNGPVQNQVGLGVIQPVRGPVIQAFGGNNQSGPIDVATARNACASASGRLDFETETFLVTARETDVHYAYYSHDYANDRITAVSGVNPALTASNTASWNLNIAVPVAFAIQAGALRTNPNSGPDGVGVQTDHAYTLEARAEVQAVAFSSKDYGADATNDLAPTLRAMNHAESHANGGGQMAVAYTTKLHSTGSNNAGTRAKRSTCRRRAEKRTTSSCRSNRSYITC